MTAEEIRATKNSADDGAWECAEWLKEIAAQLAEANERDAKRAAVVESMLSELGPVIPKIKEFVERVFEPPTFPPVSLSPGVGFVSAAVSSEIPAQLHDPLLQFLIDKGHSIEKAVQILTNHADAVRAEFEAAAGEKAGSNAEQKKENAPTQQEGAIPPA